MHRTTPLTSAFIAYTSGGARALVDTINDDVLMQEMKGTFMHGEARDRIESPQNYGFTSVVMPATKGANGMIKECAEAFMSFMGGNRSFPIATVMDDRRFRLKKLKPGDVAFYDHSQQQLHFNKDGAFLTGLTGKKVRFSLADANQQQQGAGATARAEPGDAQSTTGQQQGSQAKGQEARYDKAGKDSKQYVEINPEVTEYVNKKQKLMLQDKDVGVHVQDGKVYLGGDPGKHKFAKVITTDGPSVNVYARID